MQALSITGGMVSAWIPETALVRVVRQAGEAANDLARRIRAFRANPKAYSKYTHQFVHILDERWPKFDVQDHHFYPAREPYSSNQQRFAQH
jgi:hypothetical protein